MSDPIIIRDKSEFTDGMETHRFCGHDYLCSACQRPRALHLNTGFVPCSDADWRPIRKFEYRVHPYFRIPGRDKDERKPRKNQA